MPRTVNVNYVTKEVKILLHDSETESLAAATAIAAAAEAQEAKDVVVDNLQDSLDAIDEKAKAEKTELDGYTEEKKAEVSTLGQSYVDSASQKVIEANTILSAIRNEYGYPFTAATAADMTDTSKIYVYVGSETGYVNGNWYYHNGTAWVSGGVYNSTAFETDTTLTVGGAAADAQVAGDRLDTLDSVNFTEETLDWADYANESIPLGWTSGYYNSATGALVSSSGNYMRSINNLPYVATATDELLTISVPTGRHVAVYEYNESGVYQGKYGSITDASEIVTVNLQVGYQYKFAVGKWNTNVRDDLTAEFVAQIICKIKKSNIKDNKKEIDNLKNTLIKSETIDWSERGTEKYPLAWWTGYWGSDTGKYLTSNVYLCSAKAASYIAQQGDRMLYAQAPNGYAIRVFEYDANGSYIQYYGNMNTQDSDATASVEVQVAEGNQYRFTVGRFNNVDATDYLTQEFISQIFVQIDGVNIGTGNNFKPKTGTYEFFTVDVDRPLSFGGEEVATTTDTVECVLRLPDTYDPNGEPKRLIFACHGASGYIKASANKWYNSMWKEFIDALLDAGYACFDCNVVNGDDTDLIGYALGSPLYINVAKTAYDYIQRNYNVKKEIFVHGTSMGGVGATAFAHAFPQLVLAESSFAGRDIVQYINNVKDNNYTPTTNMATVYGYASDAEFVTDKWSHVDGNAPSLALIKYTNGIAEFPPDRATDFEGWCDWFSTLFTNTDMETLNAIRTVPYKSWNSWADSPNATRFDQKLIQAYNRGSACPSYGVIYEDATHTELSYGQVHDMRNQLINWYQRWE